MWKSTIDPRVTVKRGTDDSLRITANHKFMWITETDLHPLVELLIECMDDLRMEQHND